MFDTLLKFKGSDWVGMVFGLIATWMLAKERRWGFIAGIIGGLGWVTFGILAGSVAGVIANLCFMACNLHGFIRWKNRHKGVEG